VIRAATFSAVTLPIERWPTPEHLYSATGLAPAVYQSSTVTRRGKISRQGLAEHRDALMSIAWGLSSNGTAFRERPRASCSRHAANPSPSCARPPRLPALLAPASNPTPVRRTASPLAHGGAGGDGFAAMPHDGAN